MLICECRGADGVNVSLPEVFEDLLNVFLLGELNVSCLTVLGDMHAKDVGDLTKVCHAVVLLEFLLIANDYFQVFAGHSEVINIECNDRYFAVLEADKDSMIRLGAGIAHHLKPGIDIIVPHMASLFGAVDGFDESEYHAFRDIKTWWGCHEDVLFKLLTEVGIVQKCQWAYLLASSRIGTS